MTRLEPYRGFTLIEALVYIGLFSLLIGGAVVGAFGIFEAVERGGTITMLQDESDFLISKTEWALSGAQAVTAPALGSSGNSLSVVKYDTSFGNPLVVSLSGANLTLSRAGGTPALLNNTNVQVMSVVFTHAAAAGNGLAPESVQTVLTLAARTPAGSVVTRTATSTVYLRH